MKFFVRHFLVALTVLLLSWPLSAAAFSVQPLKYTLTIDPGTSQIVFITLTNNEVTAETFGLSVSGVNQDELGRTIIGGGFDVAESWAKPVLGTIKLGPGENKKIGFLITVPANAYPGEHLLALTAETLAGSGSVVGLAGRLAVLVSVRVAGLVNESVRITDMTVRPFINFDKTSLALTVSWRNLGTVAVPLAGELVVHNWLGQPVARQKIYLGNNLLPQTTRRLNPSLAALVAPLQLPGRYEMQIITSYGLTRQRAMAAVTFWYFPPWSVWLGLGLVIVGGGWLVSRRFKKAPPSAV